MWGGVGGKAPGFFKLQSAVCLWFVYLMWRAGERTGHKSREVRETWRERDREEETEDAALGGQRSISTPSERKRSVR